MKLFIILDKTSISSNNCSGTFKYPNSEHINKTASVSANEAFAIFRKWVKSLAVLLLFPSAIFRATETVALFNCCFRLYSSDFGKISACS